MAKRIFRAVVLFFALYAFVFVPLGRKTALEHVRAIFTSPQAKQAGTELKGGVERLVKRLRSQAEEATRDDGPGREAPERTALSGAAPAASGPRGPERAVDRPVAGGPDKLPSHAPSAPGDLDLGFGLDQPGSLPTAPGVDLDRLLKDSKASGARGSR